MKIREEEQDNKNNKNKKTKQKPVPGFFTYKRHVVLKNQLKSLQSKKCCLNICKVQVQQSWCQTAILTECIKDQQKNLFFAPDKKRAKNNRMIYWKLIE